MVPCSGLFADTGDGSLKQTVMEGNHPKVLSFPTNNFYKPTSNTWVYPGFQSLTAELGQHGGVRGRKERLYHLKKAVANSIEMEQEGLSSMQEKYDMYKKGYLKFLRFDPDEKTSRNEPTFGRLHLNPQRYASSFQLLQSSMLH